jgi:hypothetical protein
VLDLQLGRGGERGWMGFWTHGTEVDHTTCRISREDEPSTLLPPFELKNANYVTYLR